MRIDAKIGFTGTKDGMTCAQRYTLAEILKRYKGEFHHGDCIGGDHQSHDEAEIQFAFYIVVHPPIIAFKRAWRKPARGIVLEPKEYLDRDRDIVDATEQLIAAPKTYQEQVRSGTWYTVRYARKLGRPIKIVWPDGSQLCEQKDLF